MVGKKSFSRILFLIFAYTLVSLICVACILPVVHVIMASISDPGKVNTHTGIILRPLGKVSLNGYRYLLQFPQMWIGYRNTLFYVVMQCIITIIPTFIAGYVLSRKRFMMRNAIMVFLTFTMLFNGGMIPTYMVVRNLGMIDTVWSMLIPGALNVYYIIIMRTAISEIPDSLEESARIDGANSFVIMFRIIMPLCKATVAVIILFVAVAKWNEYMSALMYLKNQELFPLQMFLRKILIEQQQITAGTTAINRDEFERNASLYKTLVKYCSIVVSTLPIMLIYPFVQKYFVTGMTIGAVKG